MADKTVHASRILVDAYMSIFRNTPCLVVLLGWIVLSPGYAFAASSFSRSHEFSPMKMSQADLTEIIRKTREQISRGKDDSGKFFIEELRLTDGTSTTTLKDNFLLEDISRAPKQVLRVNYSFHRPDGGISDVSIELNDYERRLTVSGVAPDHVEAAFLLLKSNLAMHESSFALGGTNFRLVLMMVGLIGFGLFSVFGNALWRLPGWWSLLYSLPLVIAQILMFTLPWARWFPGFELYLGDASFTVRYGPEISFISLMVGVIGVLPVLAAWFKKAKPTMSAADATVPTTSQAQSESPPQAVTVTGEGRKRRKKR